ELLEARLSKKPTLELVDNVEAKPVQARVETCQVTDVGEGGNMLSTRERFESTPRHLESILNPPETKDLCQGL
ncbi:hypothetical protein PIB30_102372, partial [Stylosanthes scabra]|nr:hypothetical protein [Stylosanthes scabra]